MIIPKSLQPINIGDTIINIKEINELYYIIPPGHEFNVIDFDKNYSVFICEDVITKLKIRLREDYITKKINLQLAKKEFIFKQETIKYKEHIFKKCPNADYDYDDRDRYNSCKLKSGRFDNICQPNIECAKFLKKDDINGSIELLKHLRLNKINIINKLNQ